MTDERDRSAEQLEYMQTGFLARVAHDIRGPSGVALTALDELENALGREGATAHAPLLAIVRRSAKRVLRIAEKLSRASEAAHGPLYSNGLVRLNAVVEKAARDAESIEGRRNVQLTLSLDGPGANRIVDTDAAWLESILVEVVANAMKHARSKVNVAIDGGGPDAAVVVTDDGRGPPAQVRPLFEPSTERSGLGVSLALADRFVRDQGGRLEVGAGETGGSVVKLHLKTIDAQQEKSAAGGASTDAGKGRRILVVDDDADTVDLIAFALDRAGFVSVSAASLADARRALASGSFHAVVTDLSLPDGAGSEIPELPGAERLRLRVLVSGHGGEVVRRHNGARGFDHQLVKPIDLDELVQILQRD